MSPLGVLAGFAVWAIVSMAGAVIWAATAEHFKRKGRQR